METALDKKCPVCATDAALEAKFCSGCGHEYRTVFHEQSSVAAPVAQGPFTPLDSRWAPVLAVVPVLLLAVLVKGTPTPPDQASTQTVAVQQVAPDDIATMQKDIQGGMSMDAVKSVLGTPTETHPDLAGTNGFETWTYVVHGDQHLDVHFDSSMHVDNVRAY